MWSNHDEIYQANSCLDNVKKKLGVGWGLLSFSVFLADAMFPTRHLFYVVLSKTIVVLDRAIIVVSGARKCKEREQCFVNNFLFVSTMVKRIITLSTCTRMSETATAFVGSILTSNSNFKSH